MQSPSINVFNNSVEGVSDLHYPKAVGWGMMSLLNVLHVSYM